MNVARIGLEPVTRVVVFTNAPAASQSGFYRLVTPAQP
jgi:hypothetical protein